MTDAPAARLCAWCDQPIPARARRDSVYCGKSHRQAAWRFLRDVGRGTRSREPLRLAYADPPYPGLSGYYKGHPDYAGEVDHAELIAGLAGYDGWALSTSARALPSVLAMCPPGVRVAAWVKGERATRAHGPLSAWEPVIYSGGRAADPSRVDARRVDALVHGVAPRLTDPRRVIGAKPAAFARWLFVDLLGAHVQDSLDDLFPGSGGIARAWTAFTTGELVAPSSSDASRRTGATRRIENVPMFDPLEVSAR